MQDMVRQTLLEKQHFEVGFHRDGKKPQPGIYSHSVYGKSHQTSDGKPCRWRGAFKYDQASRDGCIRCILQEQHDIVEIYSASGLTTQQKQVLRKLTIFECGSTVFE